LLRLATTWKPLKNDAETAHLVAAAVQAALQADAPRLPADARVFPAGDCEPLF
jgi:hypothetical protein